MAVMTPNSETYMIPVVVCFGGNFDESNNFAQSSLFPLLVDESSSFASLMERLRSQPIFQNCGSLYLFVSINLGVSSSSIVDIKRDDDVVWYFSLLKSHPNNFQTYPLIVVESFNQIAVSESIECHSNSTDNSAASSTTSNVALKPRFTVQWQGLFSESSDVDSVDPSAGLRTLTDDTHSEKHEVDDIKVGSVFENKEKFNTALNIMCIMKNFQIRVLKSNTQTLYVRCLEDGCSWAVRASKYQNADFWKVVKFHNEHTCNISVVIGDHRQATNATVSECVKDDFVDAKGRVMCPFKIVEFMRKKFGITISYFKAWKARELSLSSLIGSPEKSYELLPYFANALKIKNPGSHTAYLVDNGGKFKYFFMSIAASMEGYVHCRPVVSVDGTSLKNKYLGTLLIACCLDGNNQIYPLAFAVVDSENVSSYKWFFNNMKNVISYRPDLVFISDGHLAIPGAIAESFPYAEHGLCVQHLKSKVRTKFKDPSVMFLFDKCARLYVKKDFLYYMGQMEKVAPGITEYLQQLGLQKWARCHFKCRRFNIMTTNISESLNNTFVTARDLPIAAMVEAIRQKLQDWFYERRMAAGRSTTFLTTWAEKRLQEQVTLSRQMTVRPCDIHEYKVTDCDREFIVRLDYKSCDCLVWNMEQIPCPHACAVISKYGTNFYSHTSEYYYNSELIGAYSATIHPVGNQDDWCELSEPLEKVIEPTTKRGIGRPRKERIPSAGELKKTKQCTRCKGFGHNRKTCKNPISNSLKAKKKIGKTKSTTPTT